MVESNNVSTEQTITPPYRMESAPGTETVFNGRRYLYFGGVSYYGLHANAELMERGIETWRQLGLGSATSRLGMGTTPIYPRLEEAAARFFGTEDAAYLVSGYLSNLAGVQALADIDPFDVVFVDEHSHYCVIDAAMASGTPVHRFAHLEPDDLRRNLEQHLGPSQRPLLMTDGLFPVYGRIPPVSEYLEILEPYDGTLWLDDAHPVGILGPNGRGTYDHFGVAGQRLLFGGTLSKAFGGFGGIIPGTADFVHRVRRGPVMIGAGAPPNPVAAATLAGIEMVTANPQWRERLWANARRLKSGIRGLGLEVEDDHVPIVAFAVGDAETMNRTQQELMARGIAIQYVLYQGSGPEGVLRMTVFSTHTDEHIDRLIDELGRVL